MLNAVTLSDYVAVPQVHTTYGNHVMLITGLDALNLFLGRDGFEG